MRRVIITFCFLAAVLTLCPAAAADIYVWTDEDGVKHITNYEPPPQAEVLLRTPEIEYDAEADRRRRAAEERARLAHEKRELERREAQLAAREREAERLIEATERLADRLSDSRLRQQDTQPDDYGRTVIYRDRKFFRGKGLRPHYYRKDGSIFYRRPPHRPHPRLKDDHGRAKHVRPGRHQRGKTGDRDPHDLVRGPRSPRKSARYPGSPYAYERRY